MVSQGHSELTIVMLYLMEQTQDIYSYFLNPQVQLVIEIFLPRRKRILF